MMKTNVTAMATIIERSSGEGQQSAIQAYIRANQHPGIELVSVKHSPRGLGQPNWTPKGKRIQPS
jgi:hypothetical protein